LVIFDNDVAFGIPLEQGMTTRYRDIGNPEIVIMASSYLYCCLGVQIDNMQGL
jgi:hypothetical protein